ncbi:MAG: flagellar export chaperone FliS [Acidobacteriia bacterium]|nr:flagellar export chaperone FliS [Terriglobia bacterium]
MNRAAQVYRQRAVETATPVGRVVLLYGTAIASVRRAIDAIAAADVEKRVSEMNHVLTVLSELQGTLDFERGGEVARSLDRFYEAMRSRALEGSMYSSTEILEHLATQLHQMREAWQTVDRETLAAAVRANASAADAKRLEVRR